MSTDSATTDALWAEALLELGTGARSASTVDRAIARLVEVSAREPALAGPLSDLAIAHLARAEVSGSARSLFEALDAVRRASAIDTTSPVVQFNLGIVLDRLGLASESAAAWRRYLARDSTSGWGKEAAGRLERATVSSSAGRPLRREAVLDSLLPRWADALVRGDSGAAGTHLDEARRIGAGPAKSGDSLGFWAVRAVDSFARSPDARGWLVEGLSAFGEGSSAFRQAAFQSARAPLERARRLLLSSNEPALWAWPVMQLAAIAVYDHRYQDADSAFALARRAGARDGAAALVARASWGSALSLARQQRVAEAERWYEAAGRAYEALHDSTSGGSIHSQLAEVYGLLGQQERTLAAYARAIGAFASDRGSPYLHATLISLGSHLTTVSLSEAALAVLGEAVHVAGSTGRAKDLTEALARLGAAAAEAGNSVVARDALARARGSLRVVSDPLMRNRMDADIAWAEALAEMKERPAYALERLTAALLYFRGQRLPVVLPPLMVERARAQLILGDTAQARRDLARALALLEERASTSGSRLAGSAMLEGQTAVFHQLIVLALARADTLAAFELTQRAHRDPAPAARPWSLRQGTSISRTLGILEYLVLRDRVLVWTITSEGISLTETGVAPHDLERLVDRLVTSLERGGDPGTGRLVAMALHDRLITPVASRITGRESLVIVPDGALRRLPFGALISRSSGRYLVEDATLRLAANAGAAQNVWTPTPRASTNAVLVGNPAFDSGLFPGLRPLPHALRETDSIASYHPGHLRLSDTSATRTAVLDALSSARLMHFAGHARSIEGTPDRSHLVLASPSRGSHRGLDESVIYGADIERLNLGQLDLVVLSACGRGEGPPGAGGLSSLAQAFVSAGAGGVLSSLWEVDDALTAGLMVEFHRALTGGAPPAEALRRAQVAAIAAERSGGVTPGTWAAFRYEGQQ